ncbi:hypothetical protein AXF42_Ash006690 [Apostasia shenzhenica]|uniref:Uncharacterized protein n=1 Tax=Apostasia shenzhenica TaxID=1088818 RepID=A0A2I0AIX1_9ASPA|nr:hypothetical protein AXF42_Ash006690 [Apostasia shenzhenica]
MRKAEEGDEQQDLELLKAAAQAWLARAGAANPADVFAARRFASARRRPSRFKLEAEAATRASAWDFSRSLWDPYEIVTIAKKLEACSLDLDRPFPSPGPSPPPSLEASGSRRKGKRPRESKNSIRSLLHRAYSRRFEQSD